MISFECSRCNNIQEYVLKQGKSKLKPIECEKCGYIIKHYAVVIMGVTTNA